MPLRKDKTFKKVLAAKTTIIPDEELKEMKPADFHKLINKSIFDNMGKVPPKSRSYHKRPQDIHITSVANKPHQHHTFDFVPVVGGDLNKHKKNKLTYDDIKYNYAFVDDDIEETQNQKFRDIIGKDKDAANIFDEAPAQRTVTSESEEAE